MQRLALGVIFLQCRKIGNDIIMSVKTVVPSGRTVSDCPFNVVRNTMFIGLKQHLGNGKQWNHDNLQREMIV